MPVLDGMWTYRSYLNQTALVGDDADAALANIFGEGVFVLADAGGRAVGGRLDMGNGYELTISGELGVGTYGSFFLAGKGVAGTATEGWQYDYRGALAYFWPDAVSQIACLTGTVLRVKAHGPHSPAGVTASFIAVGQGAVPPPVAVDGTAASDR